MDPGVQVRHLFNYSVLGSLRNGFRKTKYWTIYSIHNNDLLADSGTASIALKFNVAALFGSILTALLVLVSGYTWLSAIAVLLVGVNVALNFCLVRTFFRARGITFAIAASAYYFLVYPLAVGAGALAGVLHYRHYGRLLEAAG